MNCKRKKQNPGKNWNDLLLIIYDCVLRCTPSTARGEVETNYKLRASTK